jgi:hypothetical protein
MARYSSSSGSSKAAPQQKRRPNLEPGDGGQGSAPPVPRAGAAASRVADAKAAAPREKTLDSGQPLKPNRGGMLQRVPAKPDDGNILTPKNKHRVAGADFGTRAYFMRRLNSLENERASWMAHWREISEYMAPRRQRMFWADRNRGVKRNEKIINSTALVALRTLGSGMHSGLTSPARPWYRFTTPNPDLAEIPEVRYWLHLTEERMRTVHARSNIYNVLPQCYADLGAFGTSCLWIDEDPREVMRAFVFPVGSYALGVGANQKVDSSYRRVSMSLSGVVDAFGYEHCSAKLQGLYDEGKLDTWVLLAQCCEPNRGHDPGNAMSKAWTNVWFELEEGGGAAKDFLKISGYDTFPVCAPRWNVNGEDIYGYSPGMDALGDVRALQQLERRKLATADKIVNPPLLAPASLRNQRVSMMSGDVNYLDNATTPNARFEPLYVVPPSAMQVVEESVMTHERRVKDTFYATLWMLISEDQRATPATAEEIRAKQDEKMLQLGPVLERLHDELLDPLIDRTFDIMLRRGLIPPPPKVLQQAAENGDDELRVEYISILAQAQKLVGTAAIDRQVAFVGNLSRIREDAIDILNVDKLSRVYQTMLGTDPETLHTEEEVAQIRQDRADAAQAAAQAEQTAMAAQAAASGAKATKDLASAPLNDPNGPSALTGLLGALGPAAVAGAGQPNGGIGSLQ